MFKKVADKAAPTVQSATAYVEEQQLHSLLQGCLAQVVNERAPNGAQRMAELIKKAAGVGKGSSTPHTVKVAKLTREQVRTIAEQKLVDLNANDIEGAEKIIAGTARSMGITVEA